MYQEIRYQMKDEDIFEEFQSKELNNVAAKFGRAREIEKNNKKKAKSARLRLEKAAEVQKSTIDELKKQNEGLEYAKNDAITTFNNSNTARKKANELLNEKSIFTFAPKTRTWFDNWKENPTAAKSDIKKMKNTRSTRKHNKDESKHVEVKGNTKEELETNLELKKLYDVTLKINKQTEEQKRESTKQKTKLNDLIKTSKYAQKELEQTGKKLDDFNSETSN